MVVEDEEAGMVVMIKVSVLGFKGKIRSSKVSLFQQRLREVGLPWVNAAGRCRSGQCNENEIERITFFERCIFAFERKSKKTDPSHPARYLTRTAVVEI
jgi:hypothetical protein